MPFGNNDQSFDWYANRDMHQSRGQESIREDDQWQPSAQHDWNGASSFAETFESTVDTNGESGLYWLWDMSWNVTDF